MVRAHTGVREGFTLIEILIALAIVGIMGVLVIPNFLGYLEKAKVGKAKQALLGFKNAITAYNADVGKLPTRLKDLIKPPVDEQDRKKWQEGGYLEKSKELPLDPWSNSYQYKPTPGAEHPYELYSYGKNGKGAPKSEWLSVWDE